MNIRRISRFIFAGGLAALAEFLSFLLLSHLGVWIFASNTASFLFGFAISFSLNKLWVFNIRKDGKKQLLKYFLVALMNLGISNLLIGVLVYNLGILEGVAKVGVMAVIAGWNYLIFSRLIFTHKKEITGDNE